MLGILMDGGWMMIPLLLCSIVGFAVIIDRFRTFRSVGFDQEAFRKEVRGLLEDGNVEGALEKCQGSEGPVAATLLVGLQRFCKQLSRGRSTEQAAQAATKSMEEYAPKALHPLENRLNVLVLVAAIAPLLGMTGTVTGMITSFDVMASSAGLDPGAVAGGISEALITTAAGLIIAIPCSVCYNYFTRRVDDMAATIETGLADITETIGEVS